MMDTSSSPSENQFLPRPAGWAFLFVSFFQPRHWVTFVHECAGAAQPLIPSHWRCPVCLLSFIPLPGCLVHSTPFSQEQHPPSGTYVFSNCPTQGCQLSYTLWKNCAIPSKETGGRESEKWGICSYCRVCSFWRVGGSLTDKDHHCCSHLRFGTAVFRMWSETPAVPKSLPLPTTGLGKARFQHKLITTDWTEKQTWESSCLWWS